MNNGTAIQTRHEPSKALDLAEVIERVLIQGDLSQLTPEQRMVHYKNVCNSLGLNYQTSPFDYLKLNGKMVLYAKKDATDQLRRIYSVSITTLERENIDGVYVVTAYAIMPGGRTDSSTGAVTVKGLQGEALANAYMKAESKAKRRVTLSICGLGLLDENEAGSIPGALPMNEGYVEPAIRDVTPPPVQEDLGFSDTFKQVCAQLRSYGWNVPQITAQCKAVVAGFTTFSSMTLPDKRKVVEHLESALTTEIAADQADEVATLPAVPDEF